MIKILDQVAQIRHFVRVHFPEVPPESSCLYHAVAGYVLFGYPIVAGSAHWRFTTYDNGSNPTHFSYQFDEDTANDSVKVVKHHSGIQLTNMPEMHVWNIVDRGILLDATTKYLPRQCKKLLGYNWEEGLIPKDYYFGPHHVDGDDRCLYLPNVEAIMMVHNWARELIDGLEVKPDEIP